MSPGLLPTQDVAWFHDDLTGARTAAARLAEHVGLDGNRAWQVALAVSEAACNLVKHAVDGAIAILLRSVHSAQHAGIEFLAMDGGPGMADVAEAMRDGHSTAGTLGIGLGMIARLADAFHLHSVPGQGTVMLARFWPRQPPPAHPHGGQALLEPVVQGVTRPMSGARECGDGWVARLADAGPPGHRRVHDPRGRPAGQRCGAGDALRRARPRPAGPHRRPARVRAFATGNGRSPQEVMEEIHRQLNGTRGAAVAVARIESDRQWVLYCGVGDIAAAIVTPTSKTALPCLPGIAGRQIRTPRTTVHPPPGGSALVLHSDGLVESREVVYG